MNEDRLGTFDVWYNNSRKFDTAGIRKLRNLLTETMIKQVYEEHPEFFNVTDASIADALTIVKDVSWFDLNKCVKSPEKLGIRKRTKIYLTDPHKFFYLIEGEDVSRGSLDEMTHTKTVFRFFEKHGWSDSKIGAEGWHNLLARGKYDIRFLNHVSSIRNKTTLRHMLITHPRLFGLMTPEHFENMTLHGKELISAMREVRYDISLQEETKEAIKQDVLMSMLGDKITMSTHVKNNLSMLDSIKTIK